MSEYNAGPWLLDTGRRPRLTIVARANASAPGAPRFVDIADVLDSRNTRLLLAAPRMLYALQVAELHLSISDAKCYDAPEGKRCTECLGCSTAMALAEVRTALAETGDSRL